MAVNPGTSSSAVFIVQLMLPAGLPDSTNCTMDVAAAADVCRLTVADATVGLVVV